MTMIRKAGAEGQELAAHIDIDLTQEPTTSAKDWIESAALQKNLVRESNAGTIAKIIASTVACLLLVPLIIAGLITAFKSAEQAQAFAVVVGTLLKSIGEFMSSAFPFLPWILIYYFLVERRGELRK